MSFQSLVKRNLTYWHNHVKPFPLSEEENLYQAVFYGIFDPQTIEDAIDLVYVSLEIIGTKKTQKKWIKLLQKSILLPPTFNTKDQIIRIQIALGFLFLIDEKSYEVVWIVDELKYLSFISPEAFGILHLLQAKISWRINDAGLTLKHAQTASAIFEKTKTQSNLWLEAQNHLGMALLISGDISKSQKTFYSVMQYSGTRLDMSRIKNNLAITYLYQENYKKALILLSESAAIFHHAERMPQLVQTEFTRVLIYLKLRHLEQAASICERALEHSLNETISRQQLWGRLLLRTIQQSSTEEIPISIIKILLKNLASEHIYNILHNKISEIA